MKLIFNKIFLEHNTGMHPENKERLKFFYDTLQTEIENGEKYLHLVHTKEYIELVKKASEKELPLDPDTATSKKSYEVACSAVGASIMAADNALKGIVSFALVRPPGHHALADLAMGFCIFNNIAIAAKYLAGKGNRVFIIDFDLHHGNGTEEIVLGEKNILYFSTHQSPGYPGTGLISKNNCVNVPLPFGANDDTYIKVLNQKLIPALNSFKPDIVALSAGFDSYYKDFCYMNPGAGFRLTEKSFLKLKEIIQQYPHFFVLEGGYNPESIKDGVDVFNN